jgi:hypothetical protein
MPWRIWRRDSITELPPAVVAAVAIDRRLQQRESRLDQIVEDLDKLHRTIEMNEVPEGGEFAPADVVNQAWMQHPSPHWITRVEGDDDIMEINNLAYGKFYDEMRAPAAYQQRSNYQKWAHESASVFGENNRLVLATMRAHYRIEPLWNFALDDVELLLVLKYPVLFRGRVMVGGEAVVERRAHRLWGPTDEDIQGD